MAQEATNKRRFIAQRLIAAIRRGEYAADGKIPSDRQLATQYQVSYLTARRAVSDLVEIGLVERRARSGTYLTQPGKGRGPRPSRVNFLCSSYQSTDLDEYIEAMHAVTQRLRLPLRIERMQPDRLEPAAELIRGPDASIVLLHEHFGWEAIHHAMTEAADRVVAMGNRLDHDAVISVQGHNSRAMELACEHLRSLGHERIGYALHDPDLPQARLKLAVWRSVQEGVPDTALNRRLLMVSVPRFGSQSEAAYAAARDYMQANRGEVTALICVNVEVMIGVLGACRDLGLSVPTDLSLLCLSNATIGRFMSPTFTCVSLSRQETVERAVHLICRRWAGDLPSWDMLHLMPPRLEVGESTAAPRTP